MIIIKLIKTYTKWNEKSKKKELKPFFITQHIFNHELINF